MGNFIDLQFQPLESKQVSKLSAHVVVATDNSTQTSPRLFSLAWDVQACFEVVSDNQTPSVIEEPSSIFTIFTRINAKERQLI